MYSQRFKTFFDFGHCINIAYITLQSALLPDITFSNAMPYFEKFSLQLYL